MMDFLASWHVYYPLTLDNGILGTVTFELENIFDHDEHIKVYHKGKIMQM